SLPTRRSSDLPAVPPLLLSLPNQLAALSFIQSQTELPIFLAVSTNMCPIGSTPETLFLIQPLSFFGMLTIDLSMEMGFNAFPPLALVAPDRNSPGDMWRPPERISKCKCGPVEFPVFPERPMF